MAAWRKCEGCVVMQCSNYSDQNSTPVMNSSKRIETSHAVGVPAFEYADVMSDGDVVDQLVHCLEEFGAAVICNVIPGDELAAMKDEFLDTIAASMPRVDEEGAPLNATREDITKAPPGSNGCSIAKDCGYPQSKIAWKARLAVLPIFRKLYGLADDADMVTSLDALFAAFGEEERNKKKKKKRKRDEELENKSTLKAHYDFSEDPESPPQRLRTALLDKTFEDFAVAMKDISLHADTDTLRSIFEIVIEIEKPHFALENLLSELETNPPDRLGQLGVAGLARDGAWTELGRRCFESAIRVVHSKPRLTNAIQGILTIHSTAGVGTVFDGSTLADDETRRIARCGPQREDESKVERKSCFRPLTPEDAAARSWTEPQGGSGNLVLWSSKKAHTNSLPKGAERCAAAVAWLPAYTRSAKTKDAKLERVVNGGGTNHWASECIPNGSVNRYYNSPKQPHRFWCVPNHLMVNVEDAKPYV